MINKIGLAIVLLIILLTSCSNELTVDNFTTFDEVATEPDEVTADDYKSSAVFPSSNISNPFGNQKLFLGNSEEFRTYKLSRTIIYDQNKMRYLFFQLNGWNYTKGTILANEYSSNNDEPATQDILAKINAYDLTFDNRITLSNFIVQDIRYDCGNIFYKSSDGIIRRFNTKTENSDDIFNLYANNVERFIISDNVLYYTTYGQNADFKHKSLRGFSLDTHQSIQIEEDILDFQVISSKVFYANEKGIFQFFGNEKKQLLSNSNILDFLVDGVLLYKNNTKHLFNANDNVLVAVDVNLYNKLGEYIIYSATNGLFQYDLSKRQEELLIDFNENNWKNRDIISINVYNDKIFLNILTQGKGPERVNSIYIYDLSNNSLYPLVSIKNNETQTYTCKEMGYELSYPIGYVIQFDPGSYYSGRTLFTNPNTGEFIQVMNYGYFYGEIDMPGIKGMEIFTDEGIAGYYNFTSDENEFKFSCVTENGFRFIGESDTENADSMKEVCINMIKSFKVLDG